MMLRAGKTLFSFMRRSLYAFLGIVLPGLFIVVFLSGMSQAKELFLSSTGEDWTSTWRITQTAKDFPEGGKIGFYKRVSRVGNANPRNTRKGVLYLYPERRRPVVLEAHVFLPEDAPFLSLSVAANRNPQGEWLLTVFVDDKALGEERRVSGKEGWLDLTYDLSAYAQRRVDIRIEARASSRQNPYIFIDTIETGLNAVPQVKSNPDAGVKGQVEGGFFDRAYKKFLDILHLREENRSQRLQDQSFQDQNGTSVQ